MPWGVAVVERSGNRHPPVLAALRGRGIEPYENREDAARHEGCALVLHWKPTIVNFPVRGVRPASLWLSHLERPRLLSNKARLELVLRGLRRAPGEPRGWASPETLIIALPAIAPDETAALRRLAAAEARGRAPAGANAGGGHDDNVRFIIKPAAMNRGQGIDFARSAGHALELVAALRGGCIVQRYVPRPLLVRPGRKFDVRVLAVVVCDARGVMACHVFQQAYMRLTAALFDPRVSAGREVHLTNHSVQGKLAASGPANEEGGRPASDHDVLRPLETLDAELLPEGGAGRAGGASVQSVLFPAFESAIAAVVSATARAVHPCRRPRCFELLGFDFLIDTALTAHMLEVNSNPAIENAAPFIVPLFADFLDGVFGLTVDSDNTAAAGSAAAAAGAGAAAGAAASSSAAAAATATVTATTATTATPTVTATATPTVTATATAPRRVDPRFHTVWTSSSTALLRASADQGSLGPSAR
jgi:hypothetical protein